MTEDDAAGNLNLQPAGAALPLGWFTYCLTVKDLAASTSFYQQLGFNVSGGVAEENWLALNNAATDLTILQQGLPANCLNFRGADIHRLAAEHRARGLELQRFAEYDPAAWPAAWHSAEDGRMLPLEGSGSYTIIDPDGNVVFLDTVPLERARQAAGQPYCWPGFDGSLQPGQQPIGWLHLCLNVADIAVSVTFYQRLGLGLQHDHCADGWAILGHDVPGCFRLALFQGHIERNLMNFRGENISALANRLSKAGLALSRDAHDEADGSASCEIVDPDGNVIYFNTLPGEAR